MGIKYSTGRKTRVRHSTAMEWEDLEKAKKKYDPIKHSTGENATIRHATGTEFDYKVLSEQLDKEKKVKSDGLHSKVRSKTKTGSDEYLERYHQSLLKKRAEERGNK